MVGFLAAALGYRPFCSPEEIVSFVVRTIAHPVSAHDARLVDGGYVLGAVKPRALMIYDTSSLRTWLVADDRRLYIISDDLRWEDPSIAESVPLSSAQPVGVTEAPKPTISFGSHGSRWTFSRILFQRVAVKDLIEDFLKEGTA